jgi:hypothetical protein
MLMKKNLKFLTAIMLFAFLPTLLAPTRATPKLTPNSLIADLYYAHNHKRSPFFQTRSRALVYKYFEKDLADLIWKDAVTSKGEVGVIDGDPLYAAQDMQIRKFAIAKARNEGEHALVDVTFENYGQKNKITFVLVNGPQGWKIHDIVYGDGGTMRGWFKEGAGNK